MVKAPGKEIPLRFSNCERLQETDHVVHSVDLRRCDPGSTFNTIKGIEDGGLLHNGVRINENYHCGILDKEAEYICLGVFFVCFVVIHDRFEKLRILSRCVKANITPKFIGDG